MVEAIPQTFDDVFFLKVNFGNLDTEIAVIRMGVDCPVYAAAERSGIFKVEHEGHVSIAIL